MIKPSVLLVAIAAACLGADFKRATLPTVGEALNKAPDWYTSDEGRRFVRNVLANQSEAGSWAKNKNSGATAASERPKQGTFDNGATVGELRLLNRVFNATGDTNARSAFLKGVDHILAAQYPTGGWPQRHPPGKDYHRHITYNDGTMIRLMEFLREIISEPEFAWIDGELRGKARAAFDRGIDCILDSQIEVDGQLTAWCAQHDEITLKPRPARSYELVSLSGAESAGILRFLMTVENPDERLKKAIEAGVKWFGDSKITGLRQEKDKGEKKLVADPAAPPLWARFYEIETNRPIFSGRDGVKKYNLMEIEAERRNGYSWFGEWGKTVLNDYRKWRAARERGEAASN